MSPDVDSSPTRTDRSSPLPRSATDLVAFQAGAALARLHFAMQAGDRGLLAEAVRDLHEIGADVPRLYESARLRHADAPQLETLAVGLR